MQGPGAFSHRDCISRSFSMKTPESGWGLGSPKPRAGSRQEVSGGNRTRTRSASRRRRTPVGVRTDGRQRRSRRRSRTQNAERTRASQEQAADHLWTGGTLGTRGTGGADPGEVVLEKGGKGETQCGPGMAMPGPPTNQHPAPLPFPRPLPVPTLRPALPPLCPPRLPAHLRLFPRYTSPPVAQEERVAADRRFRTPTPRPSVDGF